MSYITKISKEADWLKAGQNFVSVATDSASQLGLSASQITGLTNAFDAFDTAYSGQESQYQLYRASVETKEAALATFETLVRRYARQFRSNLAISDSLLEQLGVAPHSVPITKSAPKQVLQLVATTNSVGQVFLKFKRNGNISGTTFWIQTQDESGSWNTIETSTTSRVTLEGFAPGNLAWFRVIATRRGIKSAPSDAVSIYGAGDEGANLSIAA